MRVADASAKLHPAATIEFAVLNCKPAIEEVEETLGRFDFKLEDVDGQLIGRVQRRAGYVHVTERLRDLFERGLIDGRSV